jgi:hypothetical protein
MLHISNGTVTQEEIASKEVDIKTKYYENELISKNNTLTTS